MGRKQGKRGQETKSKIIKRMRRLNPRDSHFEATRESGKRTIAVRLSIGPDGDA